MRSLLLHQSINHFSQTIRNVSDNFHFLIGFLRINWNDMFIVLVFWLSQKYKFFAYGILIIVTVMSFNSQLDFCNSEKSHLCFLFKKKWDNQSLFCYTRRHSSVSISNVYLKALVECWHVHVTLEYLSASQKSTQVLWVFLPFSQNYMRSR